jgi:D-3-phosphoglycerate dehydrogenase
MIKSRETTLILESQDYSQEAVSIYKELGDLYFGQPDASLVSSITILVPRLNFRLDEAFLSPFTRLSYIVSPTTGLDHIELSYCKSRGITVFSLAQVRDSLGQITSTAELALGLIIAIARKQHHAINSVIQESRWDRDNFKTRQLSGLTLGIIGFGRIGKIVAKFSKNVFETVLINDISPDRQALDRLELEDCSLSRLLQNSDIITLHANVLDPGLPIIGAKELGKMKPDAMIVNTARSLLVDESAMAQALESDRIAGYAADVLGGEPFEDTLLHQNPIWKLARTGNYNIILTPHIGGGTLDAMQATELLMADYVFGEIVQGNSHV